MLYSKTALSSIRRNSAIATRLQKSYSSAASFFSNKVTNQSQRRGMRFIIPFNSRTTSSSVAAAASASLLLLSSSSSSVCALSNGVNSSTMSKSTKTSGAGLLSNLKLDNQWPRELLQETPENLQKSRQVEGLSDEDDNRSKRPVFNGHWVPVKPTPLQDPELLLVSDDVAYNLLGLTKDQVASPEFVQWLSGNLVLEETWATPYALSIMGTRYTNNCPYRTGNGYGDGRAVSIAEFNGYELQLKGGGRTPFHRGADGRAVLRSSIREYLASEAMHFLGVQTTRALSLIKSKIDRVNRPWYSDDAVLQIPDMDDIRLAQYPPEKRKAIIDQLRATQKADPNVMITEPCAITCRVASSFTRIGHLDLFARRAEKASLDTAEDTDLRYNRSTQEWKELEALIWHACKREYKVEAYDPFFDKNDIAGAANALLENAADNISLMVANWIRVGFAQGNFNADNCLVGGKTMDYGPFGWIEEYSPLFAKWTGSGQHFGFMNQPSAGYVNYQVLVESVVPVIAASRGLDGHDSLVDEYMEKAQTIFQDAVGAVINHKLGFPKDADVVDDLWGKGQELLSKRVDWTLFWRQLTYVMKEYPDPESDDYEAMMKVFESEGDSSPFYEPLTPELRREWIAWIKEWRELLEASKISGDIYESMRTANPKYVLREWMLVDAYTNADKEDYDTLNELHELIQRPYDEGSNSESASYYRRAPESASARGGTAFMS